MGRSGGTRGRCRHKEYAAQSAECAAKGGAGRKRQPPRTKVAARVPHTAGAVRGEGRAGTTALGDTKLSKGNKLSR